MTSCTKNADCRNAFVGSVVVCDVGKGLCAQAPANSRCGGTRADGTAGAFPEDLLTRPENYKGVITIGSLMDLSVGAQTGREEAIRLAARQVNELKGVDERRFGVIFCDIQKNPKYDSLERTDAAVASARFLADVIGVPVIVGPSSSTDTQKVFDAVKDQGVLVLSPAATSPQLTLYDSKAPTDDAPGLLWRTAPPDTLQGEAIARYLIEKVSPSPTSVIVIQESGPYGDGLANVFNAAFTSAGGRQVTVKKFQADATGPRDEAILEAGVEAAALNPAYVLFFSSQTKDAVGLLNFAQGQPSYDKIKIFLTDSAANQGLLTDTTSAQTLYPNVVGSRPAQPTGTTFDLFKSSLGAASGKNANDFSYSPHSYDAAWLAFYGAARSLRQEKTITGIGIARGLRKVSAQGEELAVKPGNWERIAETLGQGGSVNLGGASGTLDFDPATEETEGPVDIWKITDGKIVSDPTATF